MGGEEIKRRGCEEAGAERRAVANFEKRQSKFVGLAMRAGGLEYLIATVMIDGLMKCMEKKKQHSSL